MKHFDFDFFAVEFKRIILLTKTRVDVGKERKKERKKERRN